MKKIVREYAPKDLPGYLNSAPIDYEEFICENCGDEFNRDTAFCDEYCPDCQRELWEDDLCVGDMWDLLLKYDCCSEESLQLVCEINGSTEETMYAVLYALTGERRFYDMCDEWEKY